MSTLLVSTVKDPAGGSTITVPTSGTFTIGRKPTLGTEVATTSGTAFNFGSIAAGASVIHIMFEGVSMSGTDNLLVQLGDAGGIETSGYVSASDGQSSTTGLVWRGGSAAGLIDGIMTICLKDAANFTWVAAHTGNKVTTTIVFGCGTKSLSAELTQVTVTRSGSDTFDAGSVNISYF